MNWYVKVTQHSGNGPVEHSVTAREHFRSLKAAQEFMDKITKTP